MGATWENSCHPPWRADSRRSFQAEKTPQNLRFCGDPLQMKVDEILDRLEYLVHHARHVPFSTQVMVDEDEVMDLLDQLRFNLPEEIKQANWTVQEQQRLISEAHAEASRIVATANERAEQAVTDSEVMKRAERQSQQLLRDAQTRS